MAPQTRIAKRQVYYTFKIIVVNPQGEEYPDKQFYIQLHCDEAERVSQIFRRVYQKGRRRFGLQKPQDGSWALIAPSERGANLLQWRECDNEDWTLGVMRPWNERRRRQTEEGEEGSQYLKLWVVRYDEATRCQVLGLLDGRMKDEAERLTEARNKRKIERRGSDGSSEDGTYR